MEERSFDSTIRRFATGARVSDTAAQLIPINRESDSDGSGPVRVIVENQVGQPSLQGAEDLDQVQDNNQEEVPGLGEEEVSQYSDGESRVTWCTTNQRMQPNMNRESRQDTAGPSEDNVMGNPSAPSGVTNSDMSDVVARWHQERGNAMADVAVDNTGNRSNLNQERPGETEKERRLRIIGPNLTRGESDAYNRGLYNVDRWLTSGIATWSEYPGDPYADKDVALRFDPFEAVTYDYVQHLRVPPRNVLRHAARRFVAFAHEHVMRIRHSGCSIADGQVNRFDVRWARRAIDLPYLSWLASEDFENLRQVINNTPAEVVLPTVSRVVLGGFRSLCESDGVPWESYLLELPSGSVNTEALSNPGFRRIAPTAVHYSRVNGDDKLVIKPFLVDFDGYFLGYSVIKTRIEDQLPVYTPAAWRRQERGKRHRYERFIAGYQCEVEILEKGAVQARYPGLPLDWDSYEVPYGFWNEIPLSMYYWGSKFMGVPSRSLSILFRSEWAMSVATHLMYEARGGRLWWISPKIRRDIRLLELDDSSKIPLNLPDGFNRDREVRQADQLKQLLEYVDMLAWSKIPRDGVIPEYPYLNEEFEVCGGIVPESKIGRVTPVFRGADWVLFDAEHWQLHLPDKYFVPYVDDTRGAFDPEDPRPDRRYDGEDRVGYVGGFDDPVQEWRNRQLARSGSHSRSASFNHSGSTPGSASQGSAGRGPFAVQTRIQRHRRAASSMDANALMGQLADRGITDIQDLLNRLDQSGRGPSDANRGGSSNRH